MHRSTFLSFLSVPAGRLARAALLAGGLALAAAVVPAAQASAQDASQTTLTSSPNPSAAGQDVTFTATVSAGTGTPTGTVTFSDGATQLGTGTLNISGIATLTTSLPHAGSHLITASYGGDPDFAASTSNTVAQVVDQGATTTTLTSSAGTSVGGRGIIFTASVSSVLPAAGTPTGSVTFFDGGTPFFTAILSNGTVTIITGSNGVPPLATGSRAISATYNGDSNFAVSTSSTLTEIVLSPLSVTTTSLPGGVVGSAYSQTLAATGGVAPYTWSVSSGSLPAGLALDPSAGTISGTPTAVGTSTFSVTATDSGTSARQTATQSFTITVAAVTDLAASISGPPKPVQQSKPVTLTITVQNLGAYAAQGVVLTNVVPSGAQFVNSTASQGSCTTPSVGSTGTVSCSLGTLASGATAVVTLTIDPVIKSGTLSDTATASADTTDPNLANNSATAAIQVK